MFTVGYLESINSEDGDQALKVYDVADFLTMPASIAVEFDVLPNQHITAIKLIPNQPVTWHSGGQLSFEITFRTPLREKIVTEAIIKPDQFD